jgi:hypothetical protein
MLVGSKNHSREMFTAISISLVLSWACGSSLMRGQEGAASAIDKPILHIRQDEKTRRIEIFQEGRKEAILTQNALPDARPYLHPIMAPDGKGLVTEYRPSHHPHQTGIFWGLKLVNGRDFFMKWQGDYYRRVAAQVLKQEGQQVEWQTVYEMLDDKGDVVITETQNWSMQEPRGKYVLDLEWRGEAKTDVTMGKYYVGGLFVRMPWHQGIAGEAVNDSGQRNSQAEALPARWTDVGIQVDGRDDLAHIVIFDHPKNKGFPTSWRVDSQLGFGPSRQIRGDWKIERGKTEVFRYRLTIYTGQLNPTDVTRAWEDFVNAY